MKRNIDVLKRGRVKIQDHQRKSWFTFVNFFKMYDNVYEAMVSCRVAKKLDHETMFDIDGNVIDNVDPMFGFPTKYQLLKPERCLFVDETGCNTNQTEDGYVGGELFVFPKDMTCCSKSGATTDIHFTVLPFIAGIGEAVLCAVIMKSDLHVKDIPLSWKNGIDVTRKPEGGNTTVEVYENNRHEGQAMSCGPTCRFNGNFLPCFVGTSPKASITTELLIEMLSFIDKNDVFPRNGPSDTPFLLLDGHQSRTRYALLRYITNLVSHAPKFW
jgi:hypothetical protein